MVAAAEDLWASLPGRRPGVDERDRPITSLSAQAATIEASLSGRKAWPGQGPTNPRVDQMTQTLLNAAALVRRYGAEIPHEQTEAHRDLEAARTRIMHGLYLTAHAVNVALHDNGRDRVNDARGSRPPRPARPAPLPLRDRTHRGLGRPHVRVREHRTQLPDADRFAQALAGEAIRPVDDPGRLAQALANWDIQSHRALARHLEPANILLITRTQGLIAGAEHGARRRGRHRRHPRALGPPGARDRRSRPLLEQPGQPLGRPRSPRCPPRGPTGPRGRGGPCRVPPDHPRHHHAGDTARSSPPGQDSPRPPWPRSARSRLAPSSRTSSPRRPTPPTSSVPPAPYPAERTTTSRPGWPPRRPRATSSGSPRRHPRQAPGPAPPTRYRGAALRGRRHNRGLKHGIRHRHDPLAGGRRRRWRGSIRTRRMAGEREGDRSGSVPHERAQAGDEQRFAAAARALIRNYHDNPLPLWFSGGPGSRLLSCSGLFGADRGAGGSCRSSGLQWLLAACSRR